MLVSLDKEVHYLIKLKWIYFILNIFEIWFSGKLYSAEHHFFLLYGVKNDQKVITIIYVSNIRIENALVFVSISNVTEKSFLSVVMPI